MSFPSIVRISRFGGEGSGVFIADDLVLTAGHVLQPASTRLDPEDFRVHAGGAELEVKVVRCLPRWFSGRLPSADMGVLRLRAKRPGLVASWRVDPEAERLPVVVGGSNVERYRGTVTRVSSEEAFDVLESSDLAFPAGVSGGPIVDAADTVLGIATRSSSTPGSSLLIGLPLLAETFGWLRDICP